MLSFQKFPDWAKSVTKITFFDKQKFHGCFIFLGRYAAPKESDQETV